MRVRDLILGSLCTAAICAVLLQMIIDGSIVNIASACIVLASTMSMLLYIGGTRAMELQPLSTFAIFGFCVTTQLGALLSQTVAWTSLSQSLYAPLRTFGTLAFYQGVAMCVHAVYCFLFHRDPQHPSLPRQVLGQLGLYNAPPAAALWIMGLIGLTSFAFSNGTGVMNKISSGFNFLTWAPFLLPIYQRAAGDSYFPSSLVRPLFALYTLVVCVLGLAVNARGIMFFGVVTVGLCYLSVGMRSSAAVTPGACWRVATVAVLALLLLEPLSNLATAMQVARAARGKVSAVEMIQSTFEIMGRPYLIEQYRDADRAAQRKAYDEYYIANPMLTRFVETKFHDNSLHFAAMLATEDGKERLRQYTIDTLWYAFPSPLLSLLHVSVNKEQMNFSMGDYLLHLARGLPLYGYKTGSIFAEGMVDLGMLFPFAYALLCFAKYLLFDLLTIRESSGQTAITALAIMKLWELFVYGITAESVGKMFTFIVRDCFQMIFIYLLVYGLALGALRLGRVIRAGRAAHSP